MPYKQVYVKPLVFLKHKGVTVYYTYEMGEFNSPNTYHFCTEIDSADDEDGEYFDVRDLPTWVEPPHPPYLIGRANNKKNQKAWKKYHDDKVMMAAMKSAIKNTINLEGALGGLYAK